MLLHQVFFELFSCLPCNRLHAVALITWFLCNMRDDNVERYTNLQLMYTVLSLDRTLYRQWPSIFTDILDRRFAYQDLFCRHDH